MHSAVRLPRYILRCISYRLGFFSLNKIKRLLTLHIHPSDSMLPIELWRVDNEVGISLTNLPECPILAGYPDILISVFLTSGSGQSDIVEPI